MKPGVLPIKRLSLTAFMLGLCAAGVHAQSNVDQMIRDGIAYYDQGLYDDAIASFEKVLELDPNHGTAIYELGLSYLAKDDYEACASVIEDKLETASDNDTQFPLFPQLVMMLASCYSSAGDAEAALDAFRMGLDEYPDDYGLNFNISITLMNQGDFEQAITHLERAVEADPWSSSPFYVAGGAYAQLGRNEEGLLAYLAFVRREINTERSAHGAGAALDLAFSRISTGEGSGEPQIVITVGPDDTMSELSTLSMGLAVAAAATMTKNDMAEPDVESFAHVLQIFIQLAAALELESDPDSFLAKYLVGNAVDIHDAEVDEAFSYLVVATAGAEEAGDWLRANTEATDALVNFLTGEMSSEE